MLATTGPNQVRLLCALVAAAALVGCAQHQPPKPPAAPPQVTVLTLHPASVPLYTDLPGRTTAHQVAEVRARVDGIVQKRLFEEGADVRAGQPLYRIDPAQYVAQLNSAIAAEKKAEANLAVTQLQADRFTDLIKSNAVSKQSADNAVAAAQQAAADVASGKAAVALARLNLGYTDVAAPLTGRTSTSVVTEGAYVQLSQATLLTTITQLDPIYVDLTEASAAALQLRERSIADPAHQPMVSLTLEDGTTYPLKGKLEFTGTSVDPGTGSFQLRALFPNPKNLLLPGMFVHARVEEGVDKDALLVPERAVAHDQQGRATALVVDAGNKVEERFLQTNTMQDNAWVVTGGVRDGDRVIVDGLQKVQPGMTVQAVEATPAPAHALASNQP